VERKKDEAGETELVYSTNEGDVLISRLGDAVFVGEGFNLALARKLRDTIASMQPQGPMQQAGMPVTEPALSMSRVLASFGAVSESSLQRYTSRGAK
jgi:hypothetical protein